MHRLISFIHDPYKPSESKITMYNVSHNSIFIPIILVPKFIKSQNSSWKQLRVKLMPSNLHLYSKKGVWGGKVKIINNVCNCGFQE